MKVNVEFSKNEARDYFSKKKSLFGNTAATLKKVKPKVSIIIGVVLFVAVLGGILFSAMQNSKYQQGLQDGRATKTIEENKMKLQSQSLNYIWEWFLKRTLITLGYGLPIFLFIAAIVWIIHGSLFKLA